MSTDPDPPHVRLLTAADLEGVVRLQAAVASGLPKGFLWPKTEAELRAYLDGAAGVAYGIDAGAALAAAALLRVPDAGRPNGPPRFRLVPEADWPLRACFLQNTMVLPAARGRGYQRTLLDARLSRAASAGMRWVCAGIHLGNAVSWANLLAKGMVIADVRSDLGHPIIGLLAALDPSALASDPTDRALVGAQDHARHQAALRDGYVGLRLAPDGGAVVYQRLLPRGGRGVA